MTLFFCSLLIYLPTIAHLTALTILWFLELKLISVWQTLLALLFDWVGCWGIWNAHFGTPQKLLGMPEICLFYFFLYLALHSLFGFDPRSLALILLFVQFNIHLVFLNRINYSQKVLTMIYCSNDYYRRFRLHVHTDTQLNRRCFGRKGRGVKIALITFIYTVTRVSGLKLTLLISLALKECVCFVLFVTVYFTGYGPYPGRYTLLFTLNTVPCRLIA